LLKRERKKERKNTMKSKAILLTMLIAILTIIPIFPVSAQTRGPYMDYLHIINYGDTNTEYNALDIGEIDITDWPALAFHIDKWVGEGRIPSEITLAPYAEVGSFEYDFYNQRWPTGCDGVAAREGYTGTYTRGAYTWNNFHTRQRPDKGDYLSDHPPAYNPGTQTTPMGDGADYDPNTSSWKNYFDDSCIWCTSAWGFRLALAHLTDKDYIISTILEGLGAKMSAWAAAPAQEGYLDIANLTNTSFVYHGPEGDVTVPSLIFGTGLTRPQMEAKADELLDAAGFKDWDTDGTRNDPRKVAGSDKQYGTGDDVTTSASNMDDVILYARLDDPNRNQAGVTLGNEMISHDIPVELNVAEKAICFSKAMVEYDYHIYTGGYSFGVDPWEISWATWSSEQYWYPLGWSGGYQAFCNVAHDNAVDLCKNSDNYTTILENFRLATFLQNKYACSIPLWSSASAMAYLTGWDGVVNHAGYGPVWGTGGVYYWSLYNMRKTAEDTINLGFKTSPEGLSVVSSEWVWDWIVLDAIYETMIVRNPFDLSQDRGMLASSWSTGSWSGGLYVDFNLKSGVKWHDGTLLTAEDVKWGLEFIRDCGSGVAWNYAAVTELENVTVTSPGAGGSVRCYLNTQSYWGVHLVGFLEFPSRKIWMNASAHFGWGYDPTKPPGIGAGLRWPSDSQRIAVRNYHPYDDDIYDPASATPNADGIIDLIQDGTGPWKFVGYTGPIDAVETIDLEAYREHHMTQDEVTGFLEEAFNGVGNVNYDGSVHETDYTTAGIGIDRVIDEPDIILLTKAYLTINTDPAGIDWGDWNADADFNDDDTVDDLDIAVASFFYGKSAG
jgi:ABC-type transport system substrate-binding protein